MAQTSQRNRISKVSVSGNSNFKLKITMESVLGIEYEMAELAI